MNRKPSRRHGALIDGVYVPRTNQGNRAWRARKAERKATRTQLTAQPRNTIGSIVLPTGGVKYDTPQAFYAATA